MLLVLAKRLCAIPAASGFAAFRPSCAILSDRLAGIRYGPRRFSTWKSGQSRQLIAKVWELSGALPLLAVSVLARKMSEQAFCQRCPSKRLNNSQTFAIFWRDCPDFHVENQANRRGDTPARRFPTVCRTFPAWGSAGIIGPSSPSEKGGCLWKRWPMSFCCHVCNSR